MSTGIPICRYCVESTVKLFTPAGELVRVQSSPVPSPIT
jgi:hypothetical protein